MVANRRVTGGDAADGSEQTPHVVIGYVDARAGPDSPRHRSAILAPRLVAVTVNLFAGEPEQPDHVGIRAEAAVPYSDRVLGCQPRRHQRVRDALNGEGGDWQRLCVQVRAEKADPRDRREAPPQLQRDAALVAGDRWPADVAEHIHGRGRAIAPITLGELVSSRSGGRARTASSRPPGSAKPPTAMPAGNGSPSASPTRLARFHQLRCPWRMRCNDGGPWTLAGELPGEQCWRLMCWVCAARAAGRTGRLGEAGRKR